jgi:hypothetical protein
MPFTSFASIRIVACVVCLSLAQIGQAEEDAVQLAKAVYAEVNAKVPKVKPESRHAEDDNGYPLDAKVWHIDETIRKLETVVSEDHGSQTTEFYYTDQGDLVFAFQVTTTERVDTGEVVNRREERFYFAGGSLVRWLDSEKQPVSPESEEFGTQEASLTGLEAEGLALFAGDEQAMPEGKLIDEGTTTGTFEGIEQGDYFYLRLSGKDGEEQSFMILRSEGLLNQVANEPDRYLGKKLKVHWQEKVIHIPEAGGNQQVTICVQVELL